MKAIETKNWDEFRVGDWFETIKNGRQVPTGASVPILQLKENGNTPRITVSGINNGILGYYDYIGNNAANYRVFQNFVSVSFLGTVFYQPGEASLDMKVHCLKPLNIELNEYTGKFLVSAIKASLRLVKYDDQISSSILPNMRVKLPSKGDAPDWQYMEKYMRGIEEHVQQKISALSEIKSNPLKIDHSNWGEFELTSLFDVVLSKGDIQAKRMQEGEIPLVSSGKFNNGICAYIANGDGRAELFDANIITTDMFGKSYYQPNPFYAVSHGRVNMLIPRFELNNYIAKFLVSVLDASFLSKYSFSGMCCQKELQKEKILLPAKGDVPDWHYMEMYMRGVEAIVKNKLSILVPRQPEVAIREAATVNIATYNDYSKTINVEK